MVEAKAKFELMLRNKAKGLRDNFFRSSEGGRTELEAASKVFPDLDLNMAILIKRLGGNFARIRDLKLGDHIAMSLPTVEGRSTKDVENAMLEFLPRDHKLSYVQTDGSIGETPTETIAINYAQLATCTQK
jgi:hypothetical protein